MRFRFFSKKFVDRMFKQTGIRMPAVKLIDGQAIEGFTGQHWVSLT